MKKYIGIIILILIVVIIALSVALFFAERAEAPGQEGTNGAARTPAPNGSASAAPSPSTLPTADTSGWNTYTNGHYGFSIKYPAAWQKSNDTMNTTTPYIFFGNPLNGTTTYSLKVFAYYNPSGLRASDYVAKMIADDEAEDASNSRSGPSPRLTPQFSSQYPVAVNGYQGYELYSVFEFDHQSEQIYVQDGTEALVFDFPVADANPNIASPAANNVIAREIVNTLVIGSSTGQ